MPKRISWLEDQYKAGEFSKCDFDVAVAMEKCHTSTIFLAKHERKEATRRSLSRGITTSSVRGYANFGWDMLPLDENEQAIYESALLEIEFAEIGLENGMGNPILEWEESRSILGRYFFYNESRHSAPRWKFCIFLPHTQMLEFGEMCRSSRLVTLELLAEVYGREGPVESGDDPDILLPIPQHIAGRGKFNIVEVINITCDHEDPFVLIRP